MKYARSAPSPVAALLAAVAFAALAQAAPAAQATAGPVETAVAAETPVDFEVFLPLRNVAEMDALLKAQQDKASPQYHKWLTPAQVAARFGPAPETMNRVQAALAARGLRVTATHTRSFHVSGTAADVGAAFSTTLKNVEWGGGTRAVAADRLTLPAELAQAGAVVPAFAHLPPHRTFSVKASAQPADRHSIVGPYDYDGLKQAYDYPSYQTILPNGQRLDGTGVNAAVVIATNAQNSDVAGMFDFEGFTTTTGKRPPRFKTLNVDGGAPFDPNSGASFEASLDVQQILGGAPGANVTVVSIPDLFDNHIIDAYLAVVDGNQFDLVNSSFGECERFYLPAYNNGVDFTAILNTYDEIFRQGNLEGITFVASSGDSGGLQCVTPNVFSGNPRAKPKFIVGVSTPAADPNVTAVGGTNLITSPPAPDLESLYVGENFDGDPEIPHDPFGTGLDVTGGYWGAGGGRSRIFTAPNYQSAVYTASPMRTLPDVGMQVGGCPGGISQLPCGPDRSAAIVTFAGARYGVIGTSVSSPEFVGALALFQEWTGGGRLGNVNGYLYGASAAQNSLGGAGAPPVAQFFHKNIGGFDGYWHRYREAYNYAVGNGTPDVRKLFGMQSTAPAGNSRTPSNP